MKSRAVTLLALLGFALAIYAADKPWTEWTKKDAEKILQDSNWSQTQTYTDISEPMYSSAQRPTGGMGALNMYTNLKYYISFLSAKPVRQAYLRLAELNPEQTTPADIEKMRQFVATKEFEKAIVIAVTYSSTDQRFLSSAFSTFSNGITSTLKSNCYLDVKGKRVFLQEYVRPVVGQNLGAKFIFPRFVDDKPVIDDKTRDVRFYAEFPPPKDTSNIQVKLDMRFTVAKFLYEGALEF
jgi:hypothetical protein